MQGNDTVAARRDLIAVLSLSPIVRDRRVLRQCGLIVEMGFRPWVIAFAEPGDRIAYDLSAYPSPKPTVAHRLSTVARQAPARLGSWAAEVGFWIAARHRWALGEIERLRPSVILANDWPALVVAARWRSRSGAAIHYDAHEFATLEFDERLWWRLVYKPFVTHLEGRHISAAASISTVGPSLALEIKRLYGLVSAPAVVRNTPDRVPALPEAQTHWPLRILYHGQLLPHRGLEALIDSLPFWTEQHVLTIRGDGPTAYVDGLRLRADATGRGSMVDFQPAVPPNDVMPLAAATADVGVHFTPLGTKQRHFSMPNKVFEYIGSGLAVVVSPAADIKAVIEEHGVGAVSADAEAPAIAAAINGLTRAAVAAYRVRAHAAAQLLCWEREKSVLRLCMEPLVSRLRGDPPPAD